MLLVRLARTQQYSRIQYFKQLGGDVVTEPAAPAWLHDLVSSKLGEEQAAGFTNITALYLGSSR